MALRHIHGTEAETIQKSGRYRESPVYNMSPILKDPMTEGNLSSEPPSWPSLLRTVSFTQVTVIALFRIVGGKVKRGMSPCAA